MTTNDNKNEVVVDRIQKGSIAKLVKDGIMEVDEDIGSGKRIYHLTQKGIEYVMKRVDEKEAVK